MITLNISRLVDVVWLCYRSKANVIKCKAATAAAAAAVTAALGQKCLRNMCMISNAHER